MKNNAIKPKPDLKLSNISDTDSYKLSHWYQYPKGMNLMMSYFESRGGEFDVSTLFGLQVLLHRNLSKTFTLADVEEEASFANQHGEPFNREGWLHILNKYDGRLPVRIRAIPEGLVVPVSNALMTIESVNDPECFWITNWLETKLSRIWYPSTIAIISRTIKETWKQYLDASSDTPDADLPFKHHDFGSRGATTEEAAQLGGAAHLLNFLGSDTIAGIRLANHYYDCNMSGFSIPATEHSTMTSWGEEREREALKNYITKALIERTVPPGVPKIAACVGDSYNIYEFVKTVTSDEISGMIKSSGGTLVIRPDSGDPIEVLSNVFDALEQRLGAEITLNSKGFKMLPPHLRVIQGDGINRRSFKHILEHLVFKKRWSASNIAFGSGGGLLQDCNRDTQKYAFKCCYAQIDGKPVDVRKNPITDPGKRSKAGRLDLVRLEDDSFKTIVLNENQVSHPRSVMNTVFENGDIMFHNTFDECRKRMSL